MKGHSAPDLVHLVLSPTIALPKGKVRAGQEHVVFSSHILPASNCFQVETVALLEVVSV